MALSGEHGAKGKGQRVKRNSEFPLIPELVDGEKRFPFLRALRVLRAREAFIDQIVKNYI